MRQRGCRNPHGEIRPEMRHQVRADQAVIGDAAEREQRHAHVFDRPERQDDDAVGRKRNEALRGEDAGHARIAASHVGDQPNHTTVRHQHQPLLGVVAWHTVIEPLVRLGPRGARGLHQQRHGAELVEGKETRPLVATLDGKRRFELELVPLLGRHAVQVQWQVRQRNRFRHIAGDDPFRELLPHRAMQRAVDEIIRARDADLFRGFAKIAAVEIVDHGRRPRRLRHLRIGVGVEQLRRPSAPEHRTSADAVRQAREPDRHVRSPRQSPAFLSQRPGITRDRTGRGDADHRQILQT
jgi:hypothetical protein